jgi:hypothetical protein
VAVTTDDLGAAVDEVVVQGLSRLSVEDLQERYAAWQRRCSG